MRFTSCATCWSICPSACGRASRRRCTRRGRRQTRSSRAGSSNALAASLEKQHPSAAASLREGLDETLTLQRLGIQGALYRTLRSTNAIKNLNGGVATYTRNVKRWRGGRMILRWVGAALAEVQRGFRHVRGHDDLPKLVAALTSHTPQEDQQKVA